jgi:DNA-binding protein HU-beta
LSKLRPDIHDVVSFLKNLQQGEEQQMAKVMTKSQVVSHLAEKTGIQKKAAAAVLAELVTLATKEAKSSGQFVIPGLGKAVKAARKARMGRNPQTGAPIKIPAKTVVKFRLAKAFKDAVVPPKKK